MRKGAKIALGATAALILAAIAIFIYRREKRGPLGAILPTNKLYECQDGMYSTSNSKRACRNHGGLKDLAPEPMQEFEGGEFVKWVPISLIKVDKKRFQNRESDFSSESANRIVNAVARNTFRWELLDPVQLWDDGKNIYMLSGHSRLAAFKMLSSQGAQADGRGFDRIPAKIFANISEEEAISIAVNSNTLATKETDLERANYYRRLRQSGAAQKAVQEEAQEREGKNWSRVYNLSFLSPKGYLYAAINALDGKEAKSSDNINTIADWVGEVRRRFPQLTDSHEDEIAKWLATGAYGNTAGKISNKKVLVERMAAAVLKNTDFGVFKSESPLNLNSSISKSPAEQEHEAIAAELRSAMEREQRLLQSKSSEFYKAANEGRISLEKADELVNPYQRTFAVAQKKLADHLLKKQDYIKQGRAQAALFGISKKQVHIFY